MTETQRAEKIGLRAVLCGREKLKQRLNILKTA
jgi:hypothetical protein